MGELKPFRVAPNLKFQTVEDGLKSFARDAGVDLNDVLLKKTNELFGELPERYRRLAEGVWLRLPEGWDSHADWEMTAGAIASDMDLYFAGAMRRESAEETESDLQRWTVVLCTRELDQLSDAAVTNIIAHELAHVASGLETGKHRDDALCEDRANAIMRWWGFGPDAAVAPGVSYVNQLAEVPFAPSRRDVSDGD